MNVFKKIGGAIKSRLFNTAENLDRVGASAILGTPVDETISGWAGNNEKKNPAADALAKSLDAVHFDGDPHHAEDAAKIDEFLVESREVFDADKKLGITPKPPKVG
jgi:hypothetical protein